MTIQNTNEVTALTVKKEYTPEFRMRMVTEATQSGANKSAIAKQNGVTPHLLYRWIKESGTKGKRGRPANTNKGTTTALTVTNTTFTTNTEFNTLKARCEALEMELTNTKTELLQAYATAGRVMANQFMLGNRAA